MNKFKFVKIINSLKSANDLQKGINELMRKAEDNICMDFMNAGSLMINHEDIVVELLSDIFDDKGEWISWWCFETGYGESKTEVYDRDDNVIANIKTPEDLYDFLIDEMNVNKEKK